MRENGDVEHFFATAKEHQAANQKGLGALTMSYTCAACGKETHGRVIARMIYAQPEKNHQGTNFWCLCTCGEPTVLKAETAPYDRTFQAPRGVEFKPGENWPPDLEKLFHEASASFSAGAFTGSAMICRKILMVVACKHGDDEGKTFKEYVEFIIRNVVPIPTAKQSIDAIRQIGNEANHDVAFVNEPDARRAMGIVRYVLNAAYSLPSA